MIQIRIIAAAGILMRFCAFTQAGIGAPTGQMIELLQTDGPKNRNDIVDWPPGERDGFDRREINPVINAFHYLNLNQMADMAAAIGRDSDA